MFLCFCIFLLCLIWLHCVKSYPTFLIYVSNFLCFVLSTCFAVIQKPTVTIITYRHIRAMKETQHNTTNTCFKSSSCINNLLVIQISNVRHTPGSRVFLICFWYDTTHFSYIHLCHRESFWRGQLFLWLLLALILLQPQWEGRNKLSF